MRRAVAASFESRVSFRAHQVCRLSFLGQPIPLKKTDVLTAHTSSAVADEEETPKSASAKHDGDERKKGKGKQKK
jgi:hypothetical protein